MEPGTLDFANPHRTHPLSPLILALRLVPAVFIAFLVVGGGVLSRLPFPSVVTALAGTLMIVAVSVGVGSLAWWRLTFHLDADGDLRVDSGILQRQARRLQLSRLQSVDSVSPLLARIFGLVEVRVEVAGSGDSRAVLRFLTKTQAEVLRAEILRRSEAAAQANQLSEPIQSPVFAEANPPLITVPSGRLLGSLLLRTSTVTLFALTILFILFTIRTQGVTSLVVALVTGGIPLFAIVNEFFTYGRFSVRERVQGLRLQHGLLQTQSRTVPEGRVHAVEITAPLLWRRFQWVRVTLTVAGVRGDGSQVGRAVLLPVAPRDEAMLLLRKVLPGIDIEQVPWMSAPARSRWRSPIQWGYLAYAETHDYIVTRAGRVTRRISIAPHARTQSVRIVQGPWQRRLKVVNVCFDVAPGPVSVVAMNMSIDAARPLANREVERMHANQRAT
jgi:putative membrane protein